MPPKYLPLAPGTYRISSGYGPREGGFHYGTDYAAPLGTPFYAPVNGVIVEGAERANVQGFGKWVWLDAQESAGVDLIIGHGDPAVRRGDHVHAGQLLGHVNSHGQSSGPHAHVEIWTPPGRLGGRAIDPAPWFADAVDPRTAPAARTPMDSPITRTDLSSNHHGGGRNVSWVAIHTQEGRGLARDIIPYLKNPAPGGDPGRAVSYNAVVDDRETVLVVPWDRNPWAAVNANSRADHILMAGTFAAWSRDKWLDRDASDGVDEDLMLTRTAALVAWRCIVRGLPIEYVGGAGHYPPPRPGICGHVDFGAWGGGHTDPGREFPWNELIRRARAFAEGDDMSAIRFTNFAGVEVDAPTALKWIDQRAWQNERMLMAILDQLLGPGAGEKIRDQAATEFDTWTQNGGRSLNDLTAAIGAHIGVPGTSDTQAGQK
ncbi:peptidoglycan DD-metalloendopeptidase family protein [Nocardia sp. CC201C]|uniref:peptidoglycan DD-metalloendopeptidase family protein n=1 Tax=Nocardia sp. CC201C TaxID=3044575 RepID=UPI0024A880ED|nr:peptidoglycan DD-metalloendopeptidase family protein [Nocardia sp. CC201C]